VEACPDHPPVNAGNKWVSCRLKIVCPVPNWDDRARRLFAADCAESALLAERVCGREPDPRSWEAVSMARRYAAGDAMVEELTSASAAAWATAWASARASAEAAARAAAWASARASAEAAARASARAAAWASARAAAWATAWASARASAEAAARASAGGSAEAAAWAAVKYVAEAAAWAAASGAWAAASGAWAAAWAAAKRVGGAGSESANATFYARWLAYVNGDPIPPVEPLYGGERREE